MALLVLPYKLEDNESLTELEVRDVVRSDESTDSRDLGRELVPVELYDLAELIEIGDSPLLLDEIDEDKELYGRGVMSVE